MQTSANRRKSLNLIEKTYSRKKKCYKIVLQNKNNKSVEDLLQDMYFYLKNDEDLKDRDLLVISTGYVNNGSFTLHPNLLITKTTTFNKYLNDSIAFMLSRYDHDYLTDIIHIVEMLVFDAETKVFYKKSKSPQNSNPLNKGFLNTNFPNNPIQNKRDSLTFNDIEKLANGGTFFRNVDENFN